MLNATTTCAAVNASGTETCVTVYAESPSTDPNYYQGFTAGELVTNVQLFLLLTIVMVATYHILFRTLKVKNKKKI